jgi:hypothetical protein
VLSCVFDKLRCAEGEVPKHCYVLIIFRRKQRFMKFLSMVILNHPAVLDPKYLGA